MQLNNHLSEISFLLKNRRRSLGISQAELAKRTGLGVATIKRAENAKLYMNLKQLLIICQALDLKVELNAIVNKF